MSKLRSGETLLATKLPTRELILGGWLTAGEVVLLYAKTGVGKTMVAMNMMAAISTGGSYLSWEAPKARRCLYVDTELGSYIIQNRVASIYANYKESGLKNIWLMNHEDCGGSMWNLSHLVEQKRYYNLWKHFDVIFIDNYLGIAYSDRNEHDSAIWRRCWKCIKELRDEGKCVVIVHHSSKDSRNQHGTSLRANDVDTIVNLRPTKESGSSQSLEFTWHFDKTRNFGGEDSEPFWAKYIANQKQCLYYWERKGYWEYRVDCIKERLKALGPGDRNITLIAKEFNLPASRIQEVAKEPGVFEVADNVLNGWG